MKKNQLNHKSKPSDVSGDPMCHDFLCVPLVGPRTPHRMRLRVRKRVLRRCRHYQQLTDGTLKLKKNVNFILTYAQFYSLSVFLNCCWKGHEFKESLLIGSE
ncbi:hypothetical protein CEXT_488511 [Caerostris extrusa]|uniref:Uncharacterized protein n=1 Tax=Caerostris extrusa TaxID=172846 RepID=A0AAV4RII7_CAEEX|nr:hypothetical protein CEXT_488511 [Caerostris extrusa]